MSVRMNISLPEELKGRMDASPDRVNWSGVAAAAFEQRLEELVAARHEKSLDAVVSRLLATRPARVVDPYGEGLCAGTDWAREKAEWTTLERLEDLCADAEAETWGSEFAAAAMQVLVAADATGFMDPEETSAPGPKPRYVHGFCDGALSIFEEVKKRV